MRFLSLVVAICILLLTISCTEVLKDGCFQATYSPPMLPIEISLSDSGELSLKVKGELVTPIGCFGLKGGLMSNNNQSRLIVIVGNQQHVYSLDRYSDATSFSIEATRSIRVSVSVIDCRTIIVEIAPQSAAAPQSSWCPGALQTRLKIGMRGYVSSKILNDLCLEPRPCPQLAVDALGRGARFTVVDGPVCKDEHIWWKVDPDAPYKETAWIAEADSHGYRISPIN